MNREIINQKFEKLSEEQKNIYLTQFNKRHKKIIFGFGVLIVVLISALTIAIINCVSKNLHEDILVFSVGFTFAIILCLSILFFSIITLKWSDEKKIKKQIEILENKNNHKSKNFNDLDTSKIKSVIILDSYTEMSDKLHAVLNYQEIIQTRYYKFRVNYIDGSFTIITAKENSAEYNALIEYVGQEVTKNTSNVLEIDNADIILKYKKLLDEGIITQEEFNKKKKELL